MTPGAPKSGAPFTELRNFQGERLDFVFRSGRRDRRAVVVLLHGVTSSHDRPYLVALADALAAAGIASLRFSFAGNGKSEGRFEAATLTKEVGDLGSALDALAAAGHAPIAVVGHSMGAGIGLLRAASDARVRALVSLAGMLHVQRFVQRHFGALVPGRDLMLGRPGCVFSQALADDAAYVGSLTKLAARLRIPWLLVHGDADEMVPFSDSTDACAAALDQPELVRLPGVDHRFTGAHAALVAAVVPWLERQLGKS